MPNWGDGGGVVVGGVGGGRRGWGFFPFPLPRPRRVRVGPREDGLPQAVDLVDGAA